MPVPGLRVHNHSQKQGKPGPRGGPPPGADLSWERAQPGEACCCPAVGPCGRQRALFTLPGLPQAAKTRRLGNDSFQPLCGLYKNPEKRRSDSAGQVTFPSFSARRQKAPLLCPSRDVQWWEQDGVGRQERQAHPGLTPARGAGILPPRAQRPQLRRRSG